MTAGQGRDPETRPRAGLAELDPALAVDGWERRFVADGHRAAEVVELYRQLGFEARLEPVHPSDIPDGCTDCQLVLLFQFKTVYTRRPPSIRVGADQDKGETPRAHA